MKQIFFFLGAIFFTSCFSPSTEGTASTTQDSLPLSETTYVHITETDDWPSLPEGYTTYKSLYYVKSMNEEPEQLEGEVLVSVSDSLVKVTLPQFKSELVFTVIEKNVNPSGAVIFKTKTPSTPNSEIIIHGEKNLIIMKFSDSTYYFYDCEIQ
jgi:hypothetical protein